MEIHDPALKFRLVREFLQMHLRGEITRNFHALSTSPTLNEKQGKGIDCNGSSLPYFSIPSFLRIANMLPNFLNLCVILQDLVEHVDDQKRFQEYSYSLSLSLVYFAAFQLRG